MQAHNFSNKVKLRIGSNHSKTLIITVSKKIWDTMIQI
jgi:hypothetical protein